LTAAQPKEVPMELSDIFAAAQHGAALVYHEVVAIEADATKWSAAHPAVGPLIAAGSNYAMQALSAAGVPTAPIVAAGTAVLAALKALAAADATVPSGGVKR
jgi:Trk K+ transport system NAD-binding subunit